MLLWCFSNVGVVDVERSYSLLCILSLFLMICSIYAETPVSTHLKRLVIAQLESGFRGNCDRVFECTLAADSALQCFIGLFLSKSFACCGSQCCNLC